MPSGALASVQSQEVTSRFDLATRSHSLTTLREERDLIRTRVTEMLEQIESLNL